MSTLSQKGEKGRKRDISEVKEKQRRSIGEKRERERENSVYVNKNRVSQGVDPDSVTCTRTPSRSYIYYNGAATTEEKRKSQRKLSL